MELILERKYFRNGVNGELFIKGKFIGYTIELPWDDNHRRVSCIPEGKYLLRKRHTPKFGQHLMVLNVPGRDGILIHAFNHAVNESKGCIAPVSTIVGEGMGRASRLALARLVSLLTPFLEQELVYLIIKAKANATVTQQGKAQNARLF